MKPPTTGDVLTVIQGANHYAATVVRVNADGSIVCDVAKRITVRMTFRPDGHGHKGARLHKARGVRVWR